jgi:D-psicose/D-tagatose/L-ribulose 3-epimerase
MQPLPLFAFSLLLWTDSVGPEHERWFEVIKAAGYDGVEVPLSAGTPDAYGALARVLERMGLQPIGVAAFGQAALNPISADADERTGAMRRAVEVLDRAQALGAHVVGGPLHSPMYHFSWQAPTAVEKARAVEFHRALGDAAQARGIAIALEALNRYECYLFNTMHDLCAHVREVDHPAIGAMFDSFHANIEERSIAASLAAALPHLRYVQMAESDRGSPLGSGHIDWPALMRVLREGGYRGFVSVEAFGHFEPAHGAQCGVWRPMADSPEALIEQSIATLRRAWHTA